MNIQSHHSPLRPADWLLAETVRRVEEAAGDVRVDDAATLEARCRGDGPAARIVARARYRAEEMSADHDLVAEIRHALTGARWLFGLVLAIGLLAGIAAAASLPAPNGTLVLSHALTTLLLIPLLLLLIWAGLSLRPNRRNVSAGFPGRIGWWLLIAWTRRFGLAAQRRHLAAALADFGRQQGRTLLALVSHGFWAMFFIGCILWLWLRFLGVRFDFSWETTLLSGDWLQPAIIALGWLPAQLFDLPLPSAEQVQAVLAKRSASVDRTLWAGYLLSILATYGLAPRVLLALAFAWRCRRLRMDLDLGRPGYLRLLPALASSHSQPTGTKGPRPPALESGTRARPSQGIDGDGDAVLIGVELDRDETEWPPDIAGCRVLGRADNRRQQRDLFDALALLDPPPRRIIALCSLLRTPDRGTGQWLDELSAIAPVQVQLEGTRALSRRGIDIEHRLADWQRLGQHFGVEVIESPVPSARD